MDSSGNLGIGTSSPTSKLQVNSGATTTVAQLISSGANTYTPTASTSAVNTNLQLGGGGASGATTGMRFTQGGSFELYFGGVQEAGGAAAFVFQGYNGSAYAERARIDSAGNLGLGVTPSAWVGNTAAQIGPLGAITSSTSTPVAISANAYSTSAGWAAKYITTSTASLYLQLTGQHQWFNAPSGTAGNTISFTQAMTLDADGDLGIGTTTPAYKLDVLNTNAINGGVIGARLTTGAGTFAVTGANPRGTGLIVNGNVGSNVTIPIGGNYDTFGIISAAQTGTGAYPTTAIYGYSNSGTGNGYGLRTDVISTGTANYGLYVGGVTGATSNYGIYVSDTSATNYIGGNLLVGTTSAAFTGRVVALQTTSASDVLTAWNSATTGDNAFIGFYTEAGGTGRGSITFNRAAGLVSLNTTSDYRAKDISGPVTGSGALIDSTPVYMGKMKDATQERPMFIAHEVPAYAHTGEKDAVDADGNPVYQQMDAGALIPVMWAEIQSLRKRLAILESK